MLGLEKDNASNPFPWMELISFKERLISLKRDWRIFK